MAHGDLLAVRSDTARWYRIGRPVSRWPRWSLRWRARMLAAWEAEAIPTPSLGLQALATASGR